MKLLLLFIMALGILAGCSIDASYHRGSSPKASVDIPAGTSGLTSGSSQAGKASNGGPTSYYLQSTVGSYVSGVEQSTDDRSYRVFSSVQGAIISQ